ncbi:S9 family peptidase [Sphingomicrobium sediminis]|uniref:S9 family peptidase n=1 Tax=Sphingomicrobium sediminis TaxID=2950949 RepID=A0A9X2J351_9SPHN|nr:S9 family peptidase [Sphingomicrobium sediminis]MCM8558444.1 S9 family peptidase [Sphingomicrobium sediminis]
MTIKRTLFASAAALALLTACGQTGSSNQPEAPVTLDYEVPRYSAEQFYDSVSYSLAGSGLGSAFSPDGDAVLINSDASGVFNASLLPLNGGDPVPLTESTDDATFAISFIPGSGRILYTADDSGDELNHVWVREEDGSVRDLTPGDGHKANFAGFSADGETFYIATNERDPQNFDVYAYDASDYSREMIFENDGYFPAGISGDGRWMALQKNNSSADSDLFLVDLAADDKTPQLITEHEGNIRYGSFGFTRDDSKLIYATDEHGEWREAWTYDLESGERAEYEKADWDIGYISHSKSGRYQVVGVNEDALSRVTIEDTESGETVELSGLPDGNINGIRFDADEGRIAFTLSSDTSPSDIYVADLDSGEARRLTTALNPAIDEDHLVTASVARFESYDGLEIPGILYRPHGSSADNPAPAVVLVHGGPGGQSTRGYRAQVQHLVNHGYAVYAINNRGSSGYGKTFFHLDDKKHGDVDLKDVVASKDFLQSMDWIANDRIAVMGGSYGGYMTAAALAFHPEVFDAGINIFGVTNWVRTLKSIPAWWGANRVALYDEMGDPATDEERHRAISPLFHADQITKPMLVVQGATDPRVLQVESDELVAAIEANGVPVEYVLFEDEGHGFRKRENRIAASNAYVAFLDEHIGTN